MGEGKRWDWAEAAKVAQELVGRLMPFCQRIKIAGSLRRGKPDVGDVEIVFVPAVTLKPGGLFGDDVLQINEANVEISRLVDEGVLAPRLNKKGGTAWGAKNKLAVHVASGIPVDLFETTEAAWWNYLVCRTGPAESNMRIASKAKAMGWRWNPYGEGFTRLADGFVHAVGSEAEVFAFVGLPFLSPEERGK